MTIVSTAVEANGWVLAVTGDWPVTAGVWEFDGADRPHGRFLLGGIDQFPLDADGSPKVRLLVDTPGFDRVGGEAMANPARRRTVVGTKALRRSHGAATQLDERDNGDGTRTLRLALSERVHASAEVVEARFASGWKEGHPGGILTNVSNLSSRQPVPPISRWAVPPYGVVGGTGDAPAHVAQVDVLIATHHPEHWGGERNQACAALKLTATDGTASKEFWFAAPQTSPLYGDGLRCWGGGIDLSGLNPGMITIHRTVFPWLGNSRSSGTGHNSSITGSLSSAHDTPLQLLYDPYGSRYLERRRFLFVDATSPLTTAAQAGQVVLHTSINAARASGAATKPANLAVALQAFRNFLDANPALNLPQSNGVAQAGTRAADFWEILLTDNQIHSTGPAVTGSGSSINGREGLVIVRSDPDAPNPRATTILRSGASAGGFLQCTRWWWRNFRLELGQSTLTSGSGSVLVLDNVTVTGKAGFETSTNQFFSSGGETRFVMQCEMRAYGNQPGGQLVRNSRYTRTIGGSTLVNCRIEREAGTNRGVQAFALPNDTPDAMLWNCRVYEWAGPIFSALSGSGSHGNPATLRRLAIVNLLMEGAAGEAAMQIGEYFHTQMQDCIWEGSTLLGSRYNWHNETPMPFLASGTTVTAGLVGHGLSAGSAVSISGLSPAAYNGSFTVASVLDANRFTYAASSAPGPLAAYQGAIVTRVSDGTIFAVERPSLDHGGNCVRNMVFDRNATKQDQWVADGTQTGGWELLYGVGQSCVFRANRGVNSPQDWQYAWAGLGSQTDTAYAVQTSPADYVDYYGLVNDATNSGSGTWGGDYRPSGAKASRLIGKASLASIDRDMDGRARAASFAAGAFEADFLPAAPETISPWAVLHGHLAGQALLHWRGELSPSSAFLTHAAAEPAMAGSAPGPDAGAGLRTLAVEFEDRGLFVPGD
jgi:hypothetical protein